MDFVCMDAAALWRIWRDLNSYHTHVAVGNHSWCVRNNRGQDSFAPSFETARVLPRLFLVKPLYATRACGVRIKYSASRVERRFPLTKSSAFPPSAPILSYLLTHFHPFQTHSSTSASRLSSPRPPRYVICPALERSHGS